MNAKQRERLESFKRVQVFMERHSSLVTETRYSRVRQALEVAIERLEAKASDFDLQMFRSRVVTLRKTLADESLLELHVVPLLAMTRALSLLQPRMRVAPESRARRRGATTVQIATRLRVWAAGQQRLLLEYGYPRDFLSALDNAIANVEECERERGSIRLRRILAGSAVAAELRNGFRCVSILNALLRASLSKEAGLLAKWNAAKRVSVATIVEAGDDSEQSENTGAVSNAA